jgi:hypothetical protein
MGRNQNLGHLKDKNKIIGCESVDTYKHGNEPSGYMGGGGKIYLTKPINQTNTQNH